MSLAASLTHLHTHTPDKRHQNRSRIPRSTPVITPRLPNRTQKAKTKKPHLPRSSHRTHPPLAPGMVPDPPYRHLSTWEPGSGIHACSVALTPCQSCHVCGSMLDACLPYLDTVGPRRRTSPDQSGVRVGASQVSGREMQWSGGM
jgi:hypothetical protein